MQIVPVSRDMTVWRWSPFVFTRTLQGFDLTGATHLMHVRGFFDAPGSPDLALTSAAAGSQGISHVVTTTLGVPTTVITYQIDEATIEALLPLSASGIAPNASLIRKYDHVIAGAAGFTKGPWFRGDFIVTPGATQ